MPPDDSREERPEEVMPVFGADGHLDDGAAHAFVDGALSDEDGARVVLHLGSCARCAAVVAEARGLAAAASGVVRRLDDGPGATAVLARMTDAGPVAARGRRFARPRAGWRAAAAALLAAGVGGGAYLASHSTRDVRSAASHGYAAAADSAASTAAAPALPQALAAAPSARRLRVERSKAVADSAAPARTAASTAPAPVPRVAAAVPSRAAGGVVRGEVRDTADRPLAGASVFVAGTSIGATTDDSGRFVLRDVPTRTITLRARRIGFEPGTTAVAVGPADTARAALRLSAQALDLEQVVIARPDAAPSSALRAQSQRRVRRTGVAVPTPSGCFALAPEPVAQAGGRRTGTMHEATLPAVVRLGPGGVVSGEGGVRGTWALVGGDSLRVEWTGAALPTLALRRDGATWAGDRARLTPTGCEVP